MNDSPAPRLNAVIITQKNNTSSAGVAVYRESVRTDDRDYLMTRYSVTRYSMTRKGLPMISSGLPMTRKGLRGKPGYQCRLIKSRHHKRIRQKNVTIEQFRLTCGPCGLADKLFNKVLTQTDLGIVRAT